MYEGVLVDATVDALDEREQIVPAIESSARDVPVVVLLPDRPRDLSSQPAAASVAWLFDAPGWQRQLPAAFLTARANRAALDEAGRLFEAERDRLTTALLDLRTELAAAVAEQSMLLAERERAAASLRTALSHLTARSGSQQAGASVESPNQDEDSGPAADAADDALSGGAERRRYPRVSGSFGGERIGLMDTPVQIQNLSAGGCFVKSYYPPPPDTRFELRLDLGDGVVVEVEVETVFVAPEIGYGVTFVNLSDASRRRITDAVAAEQRASRVRRGTLAQSGG